MITQTENILLQSRPETLPRTQTLQSPVRWSGNVIYLILAITALRLPAAALLELGTDESYYWLYSQRLQWNYFDHPPMIAVWIRTFTAGLEWQSELMIRLGSLVAGALSTWFIFRAVTVVHTPRAGWYAACLYTASFYIGLTAGLYAMPDTPQMVFWTFSMWMAARICNDEKNLLNWILFGVGAGLAIMSKVHGVFLWAGMGIFLVFYKSQWLKQAGPWYAAAITALIASPIVIWNIGNGFVTWKFHSGRIGTGTAAPYTDGFLSEFVGQLVFNNPINVILICVAIIYFLQNRKNFSDALKVYLYTGLPLAIILLGVSPFLDTMIYWSGPAFVSLIPLAAVRLAQKKKEVFPNILKWTLATYAIVFIAWVMYTKYYPGTLGNQETAKLGWNDLSVDQYGWEEAGLAFTEFYNTENADDKAPVLCNYWWGAHQEYYFCEPADAPMLALGDPGQIHHYAWMNSIRRKTVDMDTAYCILPSSEVATLPEIYQNHYNRQELVQTIEVLRSNKPVQRFRVYRLSGWRGRLAMQ